MSDEHIRFKVRDYYDGTLREHGSTPRGVDWNSAESQERRFRELGRLWEGDARASVVDYGCGYGALASYLRGNGYEGAYTGFDVSDAMIASAVSGCARLPACAFTTARVEVPRADYAVASGIFNVRMDTPVDEWRSYMFNTIADLASLGTRGFAFNALTAYSDAERQRPDLYYADPLELFGHCRDLLAVRRPAARLPALRVHAARALLIPGRTDRHAWRNWSSSAPATLRGWRITTSRPTARTRSWRSPSTVTTRPPTSSAACRCARRMKWRSATRRRNTGCSSRSRYARMNQLRAAKYAAMRAAGYVLESYVSSRCTYLADPPGDNCFILEDNTIQPFVTIGSDVTLWSGNHIGHDSVIGDHCFISSHVVVSGHVQVGESCFIGVNATLRNSITIAPQTLIGAGAIVMKSTRPKQVYLPERAKLFPKNSDEVSP